MQLSAMMQPAQVLTQPPSSGLQKPFAPHRFSGGVHRSAASSQVETPSQSTPLSHSSGAPPHTPELHVSGPVQNNPSSHSTPSLFDQSCAERAGSHTRQRLSGLT